MDIIHVLPDIVANQIAAGEVVQQASSVIKELVENAIDAGASHVDIYVVDSGKTQIQVVDNGKGMSEMDARMAFERHATSKITRAEDVFDLHTMGFRGEAVPSIAAVSHVTLRTRQPEQQLGTKLCLEGGKIVSQERDMCPVGTSFSVSNLFFNIPARRAHLVNHTSAEHHQILHEFERMALVNPSVSFTFYNNGTIVYDFPASNILQRIINLFGKKNYSHLLPVEVDTTLCRIHGFVGRPDMAHKKGVLQYFFVNGRFMRHPYFHKAVCEAYLDLIPEGEQVPYFLYFEVDPATIDVNIHPSKTEINFLNKAAIWSIIVSAIKESLGKYNAVPVIDFDTEGRPSEIPVYGMGGNARQAAPEITVDETFNPFLSSETLADIPARPVVAPAAINYGGQNTARQERQTDMFGSSVLPSRRTFDNIEAEADDDVSMIYASGHNQEEMSQGAPVLESIQEMEKSTDYYQYRGQYVVMAVRSGLMFIDQHRAHVRVLYNKYRDILQGQTTASQGLLFPEVLQLSASDAILMDEIMDDLHSLGFDLSPLGGGAFSVLGMPASLGGVEPLSMLNEMIDSVRDSGKSVKEDVQHRLALAMARHAALPVGEVLSKQKMEVLVADLFATDTPSFGPDGKTVLSILPQDYIDKLFK